jgi:hypothetical protein
VPHVELSITDFGPVTPPTPVDGPVDSPEDRPIDGAVDGAVNSPIDPLGHWVRAVSDAVEPCLVVDADGVIVAMSPSCVEIMKLTASPVGADLRNGQLRLIDFSAERPRGGHARRDRHPDRPGGCRRRFIDLLQPRVTSPRREGRCGRAQRGSLYR